MSCFSPKHLLLKSIVAVSTMLTLLSFAPSSAQAQTNPVKWTYTVKQDQGSSKAELIFTATVAPGYQLYAQEIPVGGPLPTTFYFTKAKSYKKVGKPLENPAPQEKYDDVFELNIKYHKGKVQFIQPIEILSSHDFAVVGTIDYMVCEGESCMPFNDIDFHFDVKGLPAMAEVSEDDSATEPLVAVVDSQITKPTNQAQVEPLVEPMPEPETPNEEPITGFILLALLAGLAAVFTPCVFPMIPMTVSFFMGGGSSRGAGIAKGLIFGFSVALIYSILGAVVALTKSADFANVLSTHWIANAIFFALFVIFACSFFGLFEITLPTGLSNKLDAKADKGGYLASFFMAAVLTLVSFSCTGPFVATLLVEAAMGTSVMKPILGMFAFGFALGLPFMILSLSPALMKKMPKSGGWLNSVKVVFAFVLLAFSMKFLLAIDSSYGFNIFTREAYLAIWIVLFSLMGLYLMGKIKFAHDSDLKHVGVFRLLLIIATFSFVVYLIPGLFGAPLQMVSGLIPSENTQQFKLNSANGTASLTNPSTLCGTPKLSDKLHLPHGLQGYFDYNEGLACAKQQNKPILIDFKGHSCANCKKMEADVWSDPEVLALLQQYMIIALYTDERTDLPESEWHTSSVDGKVKKTVGKRNADYQIDRFKTNTLPYYVTLDSEGQMTQDKGVGQVSKEAFIEFLQKGLQN